MESLLPVYRTSYDCYDFFYSIQRRHQSLNNMFFGFGLLQVIAIVRSSVDRQEALHGLEELLGLSAIQADAILNMRLAKLTSLEQKGLKTRLRKLKVIIKELKGIIRSEARKLEIIHEELEGIVEEYGDERRTLITEGGESEDYLIEEKVADEEVVVNYT